MALSSHFASKKKIKNAPDTTAKVRSFLMECKQREISQIVVNDQILHEIKTSSEGTFSEVQRFEDHRLSLIIKTIDRSSDERIFHECENDCHSFNDLYPKHWIKAFCFIQATKIMSVFPQIPGETLKTLRNRTEKENCRANIAAAKELQRLHDLYITHGDAHERNILVELKESAEQDSAHFIDVADIKKHNLISDEAKEMFENAKRQDRASFYSMDISPFHIELASLSLSEFIEKQTKKLHSLTEEVKRQDLSEMRVLNKPKT